MLPARSTRGKADDDTQLSRLQQHILLWTYHKTQQVENLNNDADLIILGKYGIPWSRKKFIKDFDEFSNVSSQSLSRAIKQLSPGYYEYEIEGERYFGDYSFNSDSRSPRDLLKCFGKRLTHIKLTRTGEVAASRFAKDPRPSKEKRAEESWVRRYDAIEYERMLSGSWDRIDSEFWRQIAYAFLIEKYGKRPQTRFYQFLKEVEKKYDLHAQAKKEPFWSYLNTEEKRAVRRFLTEGIPYPEVPF